MEKNIKQVIKDEFEKKLRALLQTIPEKITNDLSEWNIKGFIDDNKNLYTISSDTKVISKVIEIQLYPLLYQFADDNGYQIVLPEKQNWYPDITFIRKDDENIKIAVDFKTTYRDDENEEFCNGFTLGSHGTYFVDRKSDKNIQYPYGEYIAHYCLGVIYSKNIMSVDEELKIFTIDKIEDIPSVIKQFTFFLQEKWKISSDGSGSGNTANIGSIVYIPDIIKGNGMFSKLGERVFDEYWINYGKIEILVETAKGEELRKIKNLKTYAAYVGIDSGKITPKITKKKSKLSK